jgi:hypothetical protein
VEYGTAHSHSEEDRRLAVGVRVRACWDDQGFRCLAGGEIVTLRSRSVTIRISGAAGVSGRYRTGSLVVLPRVCDRQRWGRHNFIRLEPGSVATGPSQKAQRGNRLTYTHPGGDSRPSQRR